MGEESRRERGKWMMRERMWAEAGSAPLREEETVRAVEATASERPPREMGAGGRGQEQHTQKSLNLVRGR